MIEHVMKSSLVAIAVCLSASAFAVAEGLPRALPPQPLADALDSFAQMSGLQVIYRAELAAGIRSQGASEGQSPEEALKALLRDTGLTYSFVNDRMVAIRSASDPKVSVDGQAAGEESYAGRNGLVEGCSAETSVDCISGARNRLRIAQAGSGQSSSAAAAGEDAGAPAQQEAAGEEVIVTGRRDSHLAVFGNVGTRQIPLSIQVVGASDIAAANAIGLEKILLTDPAYTANYGSSSLSSGVTNGFLRGFYVNRYMANGVPQNFSWNITPAEVTERVEVLRGPTAFSYGFMSPGGAINIVSKAPPDAGSLLTLRTSLDEYGKAMLHADAGGRLGAQKSLGYRLNVAAAEGDTFLSNTDQSRRVAGLALDYRLSDRTVVSLSADHIRAKTNGEIEGNRRVFDVDGNLLPGLGQEVPIAAPHHFLRNKISSLGVQLATSLSDRVDLTSKVFYSGYGEEYYNFYDLGTFNSQGIGYIEQSYGSYDVDDLNFTTFLNGRFGEGDVLHRLTLGVSAGDSEYRARYAGELFADVSWLNAATALPNRYSRPSDPYSVLDQNEYGVFLSDIIEVRERWRALLGVRWSRQVRQDEDPSSGFVYPKDRASEVTPLVGVMYDVTPQFSVYANYATGLEPGGRAPLDATNPNELLPAMVSKQYEAGIKWQLAPRAAMDMAVFQITRPSEFYRGPGTEYVQDGEQRNRGAEAILRGHVSDALRLTGGIQYLDAEIRSTDDPAAVGSKPWGVPKWQGAVSADLDITAVPGLSLIGVVTGKSERQLVVPNDRRTGPGYVLLELGGRYDFQLSGNEARAQMRVENVAGGE